MKQTKDSLKLPEHLCLFDIITKLLLWSNSGLYFPHVVNKKQPIQKTSSLVTSIKALELDVPEKIKYVYRLSELTDTNYYVISKSRRQMQGISMENYIHYVLSALESCQGVELYKIGNKVGIKIKNFMANTTDVDLDFVKNAKFMISNNITNFPTLYRNCILQVAKTKPKEFMILSRNFSTITKSEHITKTKEYVYIISEQCKSCIQNRLTGKVTHFHNINSDKCGLCDQLQSDHKTSAEICPKLETFTAEEHMTMSKHGTQCPGCSIYVELHSGCRKITCTNCRTIFCHACGNELRFNTQLGTYYNHDCSKKDKVYGPLVHDAYIVDRVLLEDFRDLQQVRQETVNEGNPCLSHKLLL